MSNIVPNGTRVLVKASTYCPVIGSRRMVNKMGIITRYDSKDSTYSIRSNRSEFWFNRNDFSIVTDSTTDPTEITIDGINYALTKKRESFSWGDVVIASNTKGIVSGDIDSQGRIPVLFLGARSIKMMKASSVTKQIQKISI